MSNPYKLASTGLLLLLIQLVMVLGLMIAVAVGIATQSPLLPKQGPGPMFAVYIMGAVLLPGALGKVLCLFSEISVLGRVCIGLSVLSEFSGAISPFLNLPPAINSITQLGAFFFLFGYLLLLANDLKNREVKSVLISSFVCVLISTACIVVLPLYWKEGVVVVVMSIISLALIVYGTMLYMRSLVFLRRAIAKWEPGPESHELSPDSVEAV